MKKHQIRYEYGKLVDGIGDGEFYKDIDLTNRVNCYVCRVCAHVTKTIDVDKGTTPFAYICEECGGRALSGCYRRDLAPSRQPTHEWYRPSLKETEKLGEGELGHVLNGGLLCRKIVSANDRMALFYKKALSNGFEEVTSHELDEAILFKREGSEDLLLQTVGMSMTLVFGSIRIELIHVLDEKIVPAREFDEVLLACSFLLTEEDET